MKIKFLGPGEAINVGGLGPRKDDVRPHLRGKVVDYPKKRAEELLASKKLKFEKVK